MSNLVFEIQYSALLISKRYANYNSTIWQKYFFTGNQKEGLKINLRIKK